VNAAGEATLTREAAARYLGICARTLDKLRKLGKVKAADLGPVRRVVFFREDLDAVKSVSPAMAEGNARGA